MKRVAALFVGMLMLIPALAVAQTPPPPPIPPTPPAPQAPPAPPTPMISHIDRLAIDDARHAAEIVRLDSDMIRENARMASEQARRIASDTVHLADMQFRYDQQASPYVSFSGQQSNESSNYNNALTLMGEKKFEEAINRFDRVVSQRGSKADAAMYHKAYCQARLGQATEATATLNELKKSYPQSAYLKDARVIEADIKKLGPDQVDDEDLKILALQSLVYQSPDQTIPLLEGVLVKPTNSFKYRDRALFILAQIDQPKAHALLLSYAKGSGNPDLQKKAIGYLGSRGQKTTSAELIEIYNSTTDFDVRSTVITAFRNAGAKSPLLNIASGYAVSGSPQPAIVAPQDMNQAVSLRSRAIQSLTDLASAQELWPLYQKEENKDLRQQWVGVFSAMGATDQLLQIAKTEKDPTVKNRAVRSLGSAKADKTGAALTEIYSTGDKDTRMAVISAFGSQNNAEGLIAVFGKETDPALQRDMIGKLADMSKTSKVAMDFLMNIIKK